MARTRCLSAVIVLSRWEGVSMRVIWVIRHSCPDLTLSLRGGSDSATRSSQVPIGTLPRGTVNLAVRASASSASRSGPIRH